MKFWKHTLFTFIAFFGIASTVLVTSCEKDSCTDLRCKNGGSCAEGFCRCQTGFEGAECEIKTANRLIGTYYGYSHCNNDPSLLDTLYVYMRTEPNIVEFYRSGDPGDRLFGPAKGYTIEVPTSVTNNVRKEVSVVVDQNEITFYEQNTNQGTGAKSVCNFIGYRSM